MTTSIDNVRFLRECMFNVILPWDHESHRTPGIQAFGLRSNPSRRKYYHWPLAAMTSEVQAVISPRQPQLT